MIKLTKDAEIDYGAMTVDEIMSEIGSLVAENEEAKEEFLWRLYEALRPGSLFSANADFAPLEKAWFQLSVFEEAITGTDAELIADGKQEGVVKLLPAIEAGECVMFLGMSEEKYGHRKVEHRYQLTKNGRRMPNNVIINEERHCPKWVIGEKVWVYPLDLTCFTLLASGSGDRKIDEGS